MKIKRGDKLEIQAYITVEFSDKSRLSMGTLMKEIKNLHRDCAFEIGKHLKSKIDNIKSVIVDFDSRGD